MLEMGADAHIGLEQVVLAFFVLDPALVEEDMCSDEAQLFGSRKLDDPEKLKVFSNLASNALKDIPETKQTKELSAKIQTAMKKK